MGHGGPTRRRRSRDAGRYRRRIRRQLRLRRTALLPRLSDHGGMATRLLTDARAGSASPQDWEIEAVNRMLVVSAEHELNASTFAARVVASTGADLYASVLAALCSLSGPIHGGACDRIEQMFAQLDAGMRLEECLAAFSVKSRLPPGFGHAIYPAGDPRAVLLKKEAAEIARRRGR